MAACKSDKIANVKQAIQLAGKQPVVIDVDAFALQNCYEVNYRPAPGEVVALLNIGASTMNINILNGTRSVFARDASVGGSQYTSLLQKELGLTFEQAEAVKRGMPLPEGVEGRDIQPIIESVSDILALEIQKTMDFYRATAEDGEVGNPEDTFLRRRLKAAGLVRVSGEAIRIAGRVFRSLQADTSGCQKVRSGLHARSGSRDGSRCWSRAERS